MQNSIKSSDVILYSQVSSSDDDVAAASENSRKFILFIFRKLGKLRDRTEPETAPRSQRRPATAAPPPAAPGTRRWSLGTVSDSASSRFRHFIAKLPTIYFPEFFKECILWFRRVFVSGCFCQDLEVLNHGIFFRPQQHRRR